MIQGGIEMTVCNIKRIETKSKKIHFSHYDELFWQHNTVCGLEFSELEIEWTKEKVTCKNCIRIINRALRGSK